MAVEPSGSSCCRWFRPTITVAPGSLNTLMCLPTQVSAYTKLAFNLHKHAYAHNTNKGKKVKTIFSHLSQIGKFVYS